jgi:hypothetical protein
MKKAIVVGLLSLGCCLASARAFADEFELDPQPAGVCPCGKGYYEKVVTGYRKQCTEERIPVQVKNLHYRTEMREVCEQVKTTVMVNKEFTVQRPKIVHTKVPSERTKQVTNYRYVPVKLVDPHTGCCVIINKKECFNETVTYTVLEDRYETITINVKVCQPVPEERVHTVKRQVPQRIPEWRTETIYQTKVNCVMVPYQQTIKVPCPPFESGVYTVEVPLRPSCPPPATQPAPRPAPPAPPAPAPHRHRHGQR